MKKILVIILVFFYACKAKEDTDLYKVSDTTTNLSGYVNAKRDTVIPLGKYYICYTDTFKNIAFVLTNKHQLIAIDRKERVLFKPYLFDNGPDYVSDGYYRIIDNDKIGYADQNGVVIKPQFGCALPFENGLAKVSNDCRTVKAGSEHSTWESDHWFYINKSGKREK